MFFFKQKTAYEMRFSDWSSDVCSSDLVSNVTKPDGPPAPDGDLRLSQRIGILRIAQHANGLFRPRDFGAAARRIKVDLTKLLLDLRRCDALRLQLGRIQAHAAFAAYPRSEERRVGKECVRTCRYRWSPYH